MNWLMCLRFPLPGGNSEVGPLNSWNTEDYEKLRKFFLSFFMSNAKKKKKPIWYYLVSKFCNRWQNYFPSFEYFCFCKQPNIEKAHCCILGDHVYFHLKVNMGHLLKGEFKNDSDGHANMKDGNRNLRQRTIGVWGILREGEIVFPTEEIPMWFSNAKWSSPRS